MIVKICGISKKEDVLMVADQKPDFMGFVLNCPSSPRSNPPKQALDLVANLKIPFVFLFVNEPIESIIEICHLKQPFAIQLHGDELPAMIAELNKKLPHVQIWKAIHLPMEEDNNSISTYLKSLQEYSNAGCQVFILDSATKGSYGGTGVACDWDLAAQIVGNSKTPIMLAGGLNPTNVQSAIEKVKPIGVDVSSGVEKIKAKKDKMLVESFIKAARK